MTQQTPRHGDPHDYPDIPGDSGLSEEYLTAVMPPAVNAAIIKRRAERMRSEATAGRPGWVLIENEGALFRGPGRSNPIEVWNLGSGWRAYAESDRQRGAEWGAEISEDEALSIMTGRGRAFTPPPPRARRP